jgi:hypothetical protein
MRRPEARRRKPMKKQERAGSSKLEIKKIRRRMAGGRVPQEPGAGLRNPTPPPVTIHFCQEVVGRGRAAMRWARAMLER